MSMAARSQDMIANNQLSTDDYHRSLRSDMQLHDPHRHAYPIGHSQSTGPYPLHLTGVPGGVDMRQRDSGPAGPLLHPGAGGGGSGSRSSSNMGMVSASPSAPTREGGYPDVAVARQCEREGCSVQPSYGKVWKKPRFCARHKLPGMMDVRNRRCEEPNCTRQPSYGKEGQRRQFCFTHKREGDVDVKSTRCKSAGCPKHAMYGRPGEMPQYCSAHKAEDMVDVKKRRRCNADGCERRASYALEGEKAAFCSAHKQAGHVNVNNRRCEYQGCSRRPVFSIQGEKPRFCVAHKLDGMSDSRLTAARGKSGAGRNSQVAAAQSRMYGGQTGGYPPRQGVGRAGGGNGGGGRMGANDNDGDMMFAAAQAAMGAQSGPGNKLGTHSTRHSAAQATVSAAAAVIAAMEDEARMDYRHSAGGGGGGGDRGIRNGSGGGFRDSGDADMYETLHHGGAVGVTRPKTEMGGWTSALFAAERDGASWDSSRASPPQSSSMVSPHGHSEVWPPVASTRGMGSAATLSSISAGANSGGRDGEADVYRMSNVTPMGGGGGGSSQYLDDRSNRGFLSSLSNGGGGGGGGDFVSSFSGQHNTWHGGGGNEDVGGGGGGGDLQWERSRPRPPPMPAPLPSSWGRAVGVSPADMHGRHGGMLPPPNQQQRLPSLMSSRRSPLSSHVMGYGDPRGMMAGDGREGGGGAYDGRVSREQG